MIAFLRSLRTTVEGIVSCHAVTALDAVQKATLSMSALEDVILAPNVLVFRNSDDKRTRVESVLDQFAFFLGLNADNLSFSSIIKKLALQPAADGNVYFEDQLTRALQFAGVAAEKNTADLTHLDQIISPLSGYDNILDMSPVSAVSWPAKVFLAGDSKGATADCLLKLTGPARILVHGPYLGLPRGSWTATLHVSVANNMSGNEFLIVVSQDRGRDVRAKARARLPSFGSYSCDVSFLVEQPHVPIEVSIASKEGGIEGEFYLKQVDFSRR